DGPPVWTNLAVSGAPPSPRGGASALYDPSADRMIVYGGRDSTGQKNDSWALTLSGTPTWAPLAATAPPAPRQLVVTTRDASRNRLVLYGGYTSEAHWLSDLWMLALAGSPAWEEVPTTPGSFPFARYGAMHAYDPVRDRIVVYGGYD